ncbi:hypothetical protein Bca4012_032902 [Brassica carinata]
MEEGRQKDLKLLEEIIDKGLKQKLLHTIASRDKIFEDQKALYPFCIGKSLASQSLVLRRSCSWFSHSQYFAVLVSLIYTSKVISTKMVMQRGGGGHPSGPQARQMRIAECLVGDSSLTKWVLALRRIWLLLVS